MLRENRSFVGKYLLPKYISLLFHDLGVCIFLSKNCNSRCRKETYCMLPSEFTRAKNHNWMKLENTTVSRSSMFARLFDICNAWPRFSGTLRWLKNKRLFARTVVDICSFVLCYMASSFVSG